MKTILLGLIQHYQPKEISTRSIKYDVDLLGETQEITVSWNPQDPEKHKFKLLEPDRSQHVLSGGITVCLPSYMPDYRTCYTIEYNHCTYNVPLSLEEHDYVNLLVTKLFSDYQNTKLVALKSVIENTIQKAEKTSENE